MNELVLVNSDCLNLFECTYKKLFDEFPKIEESIKDPEGIS